MPERRHLSRIQLPDTVEVIDSLNGQVIGQLGNLSDGGFMLISRHEIDSDLLLQLEFDLGHGEGDSKPVALAARSLWCSPANVEGLFWSGFEIVDISDEHLALVTSAIS